MRYFNLFLVGVGAAILVLAAGFFFQLPWATGLWPLPDGKLSFGFMAAILAGAGVALMWVGICGERGAMASYAISFGIMFGGMAIFALQLYSTSTPQNARLLSYGMACAALTSLCLILWLLSLAYTNVDARPMPSSLRIPLMVEIVVLVGVGLALLLKRSDTLPWPLRSESSVMYGWAFLGLAVYYIYPLWRPTWNNARGQLAGFLAYDLVLLTPLLGHLADVKPEHVPGLVIALGIIIFSGALSIYYLFVKQDHTPTIRSVRHYHEYGRTGQGVQSTIV